MRRLFSFKSSASSSGNSNPSSPIYGNEKVAMQKTGKSKKPDKSLRSSKDSQYPENDALSAVRLRRSLSFSHPAAVYPGADEETTQSLDGLSPLSCENLVNREAGFAVYRNSLTPERHNRSRGGQGEDTFRDSQATERIDSPDSSRGYPCSSGNSSYTSPVPLRCRTSKIGHGNFTEKSKVLDLYIDGEHRDAKCTKEYQHQSSASGPDCCLQENRIPTRSGRPPRAQSAAPSSPTFSKENTRSYSCRESKNVHCHLLASDWRRDESRLASPRNYARRACEKLYGCKPSTRLTDYDSETTITVEDIYEDPSNAQTISENTISQKQPFELTLGTHSVGLYGGDEPFGYQGQNLFLAKGSRNEICKQFMNSCFEGQDTDEELMRKQKQVEQKLSLLSEEGLELADLMRGNMDPSLLYKKIANIIEDRRMLAAELFSQIKSQLVERNSSKEGLCRAKVELDTRTMRLEKEKNELQSTLERELDRRSTDWSLKLEKFQSEEQRLRERVRELAEQNVSLQREISSLKGSDLDNRSRLMNSEVQLNDLAANLEELKKENSNLRQKQSELQERLKISEEGWNSLKRNYKGKEHEVRDLQKVIVHLQRTCNDQDKTINGLIEGFSNELGKQPLNSADDVSKLRMEQLNLVDLEQKLRREVDSCRHEFNLLRQENVCFLDLWQAMGNDRAFFVKLDSELRTSVDHLRSKSLSLLDASTGLCAELLGFINCKQCKDSQEIKSDFDQYSLYEYTMKYQDLKKGIGILEREIQAVLSVLNERSNIEPLDQQLQVTKIEELRQQEHLELQLKSETLLTRLLREKLLSKDLELDQLQGDLASSIRAKDVLQSEIQRLLDELSCLSHKKKDLELQVLSKDENIKQLEQELQQFTREIFDAESKLVKVIAERGQLWDQVKNLSETKMLLEHEVNIHKKKIEALDEDVLLKEGQITILRDSLGNKPLDSRYSPKSVRDFAL